MGCLSAPQPRNHSVLSRTSSRLLREAVAAALPKPFIPIKNPFKIFLNSLEIVFLLACVLVRLSGDENMWLSRRKPPNIESEPELLPATTASMRRIEITIERQSITRLARPADPGPAPAQPAEPQPRLPTPPDG